MNPKITGCIVTYNNMKSIKNTIDSVLKYTDSGKFSLYVVDNGSSDGTPEFIRENYPEVCLIETNTNSGFGAGHNIVLPMLESEYHIVINPDIIIRDNAVEKIVEFMDNNKDVGVVSPKICFPDGREQILGKRNPHLKYLIASRMRDEKNPSKLLREYAMLDCDLTKVTDIDVATGCFVVFRTEIFKKLKGFDQKFFMYFEDFDIARRANQISRVVFYPDATIYHVWGRESKRNMKLMMIHIKSMFRYFLKWKTI